MSKTLVIKDRCLAPKESVKVKYSGKNPFKICKALPEMFKDFFKVEGKDIRENVFKWDVSADPISFYVEWEVDKGLDQRTKLLVKVKVMGEQSKRNRRGEIKIGLTGSVVTEYEYRFFLQKSFIWLYQNIFYDRQRRKYITRGRRIILQLREELKGMFGLLPATYP